MFVPRSLSLASMLKPRIKAARRSSACSVLLIAEMRIPQCKKYRVDQKHEHFSSLGIACSVVDWLSTETCLPAATPETIAILYRVPADPPVLTLINHLRQCGATIVWEVDDLIFDGDLYRRNSNMDSLDPEIRAGNLNSVELMRTAMLACDAGIASTPCLAQAMRNAGLKDVTVIENAIDRETAEISTRLRLEGKRRPSNQDVLVVYGSGNPTHDADFQKAAPGLLRLLRAYPGTRLRLIGQLKIAAEFEQFGKRVEHIASVSFQSYLALLAEADVSIAPLEQTYFNDAKSNIKFLEASILGIPSVCSPSAHFVDIVRDGKNGFIAADDEAWFVALSRLTADNRLRRRLGRAARQDVGRKYEAARVARTQVAPIIERLKSRARSGRDPI